MGMEPGQGTGRADKPLAALPEQRELQIKALQAEQGSAPSLAGLIPALKGDLSLGLGSAPRTGHLPLFTPNCP